MPIITTQKRTSLVTKLHIGCSRSSKVVHFDTNRKGVCDFLLVINSNFGPIFHCFWDTTTYLAENCEFFLRHSHLTPRSGWTLSNFWMNFLVSYVSSSVLMILIKSIEYFHGIHNAVCRGLVQASHRLGQVLLGDKLIIRKPRLSAKGPIGLRPERCPLHWIAGSLFLYFSGI